MSTFSTTSECCNVTLWKIIGYSIILLTMFNNVPQIVKIIKSKSVDGLLQSMFVLNMAINVNRSLYFYHAELNISLYGESILIVAQNVIIILLMWKYDPTITLTSKILICLVFTCYPLFFLYFPGIPDSIWKFLISSSCLLI
mmetsp:Transcript_5074/g.5996  ORF Transcript_5074/g.5996 Transcript_5074/m.5996 type:complete len:142 (-) Transcript_5074:268-693(-)